MRAWTPHIALGLVLALELLAARLQHQTHDELLAARTDGSVQEQLDALHILTNRAPGAEPTSRDGSEYGIALARQVYGATDQRLREYAFSTDICKYEYPAWQEMLVEQRLPANAMNAHWWRSYVLFKRKVGGQIVGGSLRMRMQELRWFCAALRGVAPDRVEIIKHLRALHFEMQSRSAPTESPEGKQ